MAASRVRVQVHCDDSEPRGEATRIPELIQASVGTEDRVLRDFRCLAGVVENVQSDRVRGVAIALGQLAERPVVASPRSIHELFICAAQGMRAP